jgi:hypothetical protein
MEPINPPIDPSTVFAGETVGRRVTEQHAAVAFETGDGFAVRNVIAFAMRHRHADHIARVVAARIGRVRAFNAQIDFAAHEFQRRIAHEHTGQEPGLAENLKAIANAEDEPAALGMCADCVHDRRAGRDGAASQIVAIGEPTGQDNKVGSFRQSGVGMPDHLRPPARGQLDRARDVAFSIRSWKNNDNGVHVVPKIITWFRPAFSEPADPARTP